MRRGRAAISWVRLLGGILIAAVSLNTAVGRPAAASGGFGDYHPSPRFTDRVSHSLYVPMRDGVRLAVLVSRPAIRGKPAAGRFPVIWQGTVSITEPHPAAASKDPGYAGVPSLTAYGYVVVQVARRGNGQSFGIRRGYNDRTEDDDAYDVTEWLARQPWSNGRIGVYGCSNTGDAAMHAVTVRPPHLVAAFAGCFSFSKWDAFHRGGIYAQWGTGIERTVEQDMKLEPVDGDASRTLLHEAALEHQKGTPLRALWRSMPYRDSWSPLTLSRFWYEGSISSYADALRHSGVAIYIEGGWHDELRDHGFITLDNVPNAHLLIGPWRHCQAPDFALLQEIHRFFDTYVKGIDTGLRREPAVHYFVQYGPHGGEWRSIDHWPPRASGTERLYFGASDALSPSPSREAIQRSFVVEKARNCADGWGPFMQPCVTPGEGLLFRTAPLVRTTEVTGHPVITLELQSDHDDAHVFAYLVDVAPDGSTAVVTEGRLKASLGALEPAPWSLPGIPWHRGWEQDAQPLVPGKTASLLFDLMPTSYVFAAGHRIGIAVMGSDWRESDPAPLGAKLTILSAPGALSYLDVPVVRGAREPIRPARN